MKLNKILLSFLLFAYAANSAEFKLENTTNGDYFKVKDGDCFSYGFTQNIHSDELVLTEWLHCDFNITTKEQIEILDLKINQDIPKNSNNCKLDATQDYKKSPNQGVLKAGETRWYNISCFNIDDKVALKTITIITNKNTATYKNNKTYSNEDVL
ncbi:hypothetical protein [Campylobacter sp. MG1]|uniref:hypothetical protein n=1 Tax=Campylobacter sp. MG1 TaxID=2976332 RepID=UPI00226CF8A4|nr:hypothetical protein [Campylobacter sp. MG1]